MEDRDKAAFAEPTGVISGVDCPGSAGRLQLNRLEGYDIARAVAVFGMIVVNYYVIFSGIDAYPEWYRILADFLFGRAAVLFVILAGVGITLMARRAYITGSWAERKRVRVILLKRSVLLLLMGMCFMQVWSSDILHFYSLYLAIGSLLLYVSDRKLWILVILILITSFVLYCYADGLPKLQDWGVSQGVLTDIVDDLFLNGQYPLFPWLVFFILGMLLGKQEIISCPGWRRKVIIIALAVLILAELTIRYSPSLFEEYSAPYDNGMLDMLLISDVFPTTPLFSLSAAAGSTVIIIGAGTLSQYSLFSRFVVPLAFAGRLSLTIYISHIIAGYGMQKLLAIQTNSIVYKAISTSFTVGFCLLILIAARIWFRYFERGPLEWIIRSLSRSR